MNLVRNHVLISIDAGTIMAGARAVEKALVDEISKQGLSGEIAVLETGSIGATGQGVVIVVYPEGLYYANVKPEDAADIVREHVQAGRVVERLCASDSQTNALQPKTTDIPFFTRQTQVVPDVDAFPGHIPCDSASRSEVVVPLVKNGELIGVFDIDSPVLDRFHAVDVEGLQTLAAIYLESLQ